MRIGMEATDDDVHSQVADLLTAAGVTEPPVDLRRVVDYLGVRVHQTRELPKGIPGLLFPGPLCAVVVVNEAQPRTRKRFTVAHEVWHHLTGEGVVALSTRKCQGDDETSHVCLEERLANSFASALLVPDAWLRDDLERYTHLSPLELRYTLAERYGISRTAMKYRLQAVQMQETAIPY